MSAPSAVSHDLENHSPVSLYRQERARRLLPGEPSAEILGVSPAFRQVLDLARRAAPTTAPVFITGESGTGKECIARFVHRLSRRQDTPFVPVNCAALPEGLLESELFGHLRGAFTGALRDKPGIFELAHQGTILLDELVEMPCSSQAKLLRVLQDGVVRRVGSENAGAKVDARVICATNRDPRGAMAEGRLREDLFYRLHVVPLHMPPLRERPEDIPLLAKHFLSGYWERHRGDARPPVLSPEALWELGARPWRGNVRELQNTMEHMVVVLEPGTQIRPEDIPTCPGPAELGAAGVPDFRDGYRAARDRVLADFESKYLAWFERRADRSLARAARKAGIDRTTLYRLLERRAERDATATR